jgi:hypothetical protein
MAGAWRFRGGSPLESLAFGILAFVLFRWFRQPSLHGYDVPTLLGALDEPGLLHALHPGYFVCVRALAAVTGVTGYELLCLASALGGACFAAVAHRAAVVAAPADPGRARFVTATAVATPAVVHFATVAELHAVFLAFVAIAWWCCQRAVAEQRLRWLLSAGAAAGWAAAVHATGLLLAVLLPVWFAVERGGGSRRSRALGGLLLAAVILGTWAICFYGLRCFGTAADDDPARYFAGYVRQGNLFAELYGTFGNEWFWPFLIGSAVLLFVPWLKAVSLRALTLLLLVLVYVLATASLLHFRIDERGAYLLPLVLPLSSLLAEIVPRRLWLAVVLATAGVAGCQWHQPDRGPAELELGRAAAGFAAERPTLFLLGDLPESDGIVVVDHRLPRVIGRVELERIHHLVQPDQPGLCAWLHQQLAEARTDGRYLLVTDGAVALFTRELVHFSAAWREFTGATATERIERGALRGTGFPPRP